MDEGSFFKWRSIAWLFIGVALVLVGFAAYIGGQQIAHDLLMPTASREAQVDQSLMLHRAGDMVEQPTGEVAVPPITRLYRDDLRFQTLSNDTISLSLIQMVLRALDSLKELARDTRLVVFGANVVLVQIP